MAYSDKQKKEFLVKVCERISNGEALRNILSDKDLPHHTTFFEWIRANEVFSTQYAYACEERQEKMFDEMIDIADDASNDWMEKRDKEGKLTGHYVLNKEHVQRSRLRIDTRKWQLSKLNPKKYGEKIQTDHTTDGKAITGNLIIRSEGERPEVED